MLDDADLSCADDADGRPGMGETALWARVVWQARADLLRTPIDSIEYNQAWLFFLGNGPWGEGRQAVADMLGLHADDLRRGGLAWINTRRAASGLLPETLPPVVARKPVALPRLLAVAGPVKRPLSKPARSPGGKPRVGRRHVYGGAKPTGLVDPLALYRRRTA